MTVWKSGAEKIDTIVKPDADHFPHTCANEQRFRALTKQLHSVVQIVKRVVHNKAAT